MRRLLSLLLLLLAPLRLDASPVASVDLFVATDCPIANGYAPEFERLYQVYRKNGIAFRLVFPDRDLTDEVVKQHLADYAVTIPFVVDRDRSLVKRATATTTPEVVVYDREGSIVYRGRIDNRYFDLGDRRGTVTEFYLRDALDALLAGRKPALARTDAIGCLIELP